MKRFLITLLLIGSLATSAFAGGREWYSSYLIAANSAGYGTNSLNYGKNGSTLTNLITTIGDQEVCVVIDSGRWSISNNVTVPSNITICVAEGAYFDVETNMVMTFQTNNLIADRYKIFAGAGTATGKAIFPYRHTIWGDTNLFAIGDGYIQEDATTLSNNLEVSIAAGDLAISNAFVAADVVVSAAYAASDLAVSNAFVAADIVATNAAITEANSYTDTATNTTYINATNDAITEANSYADSVGFLTNNLVAFFAHGGDATSVTIPQLTWTTVPLATETFDIGGDNFDLGTDTYTCPSEGWYMFSGSGTLTNMADTEIVSINLFSGATQLAYGNQIQAAGASTPLVVNGAWIMFATNSQPFTMKILTSDGAAPWILLWESAAWFSGYKLSN